MSDKSVLERLVRTSLTSEAAERAIDALAIDPTLPAADGDTVSRALFAVALNIALFGDLIARVPSASACVADRRARGERLILDHGALRTIRFPDQPTGALPPGKEAFRRILEPLGYRLAGVYPLPALRMTGHAYRHLDAPETIPQFFISELHVDQFDRDFMETAARVFGSTRDPLGADAMALLDDYAAGREVTVSRATDLLPVIVETFGVHHDTPTLADYEALRAQSAEAAWIATEGNAFNHATDRVADVDALAARLHGEGRPIKDAVEVSASGRVRQTALRADSVPRAFWGSAGQSLIRAVPGSFFEFISRDVDPETGTLDLSFDSGNATGIFAMTRAS